MEKLSPLELTEVLLRVPDPNIGVLARVSSFWRDLIHVPTGALIGKNTDLWKALLLNSECDIVLAACKDGRADVVEAFFEAFEYAAEDWKCSKGEDDGSSSFGGYGDGDTTILHVACIRGHVSVVEALIKAGADVNAESDICRTPLHEACSVGSFPLVKLLVDNGADVNNCAFSNISPLYEACASGNGEIVEFLLEEGADVDECDKRGFSPLHMASMLGHVAIANMLMCNGADVNWVDADRQCPLSVACDEGHEAMVEHLIQYEADVGLAMTLTKSRSANMMMQVAR